jgi:hypothetical protein
MNRRGFIKLLGAVPVLAVAGKAIEAPAKPASDAPFSGEIGRYEGLKIYDDRVFVDLRRAAKGRQAKWFSDQVDHAYFVQASQYRAVGIGA